MSLCKTHISCDSTLLRKNLLEHLPISLRCELVVREEAPAQGSSVCTCLVLKELGCDYTGCWEACSVPDSLHSFVLVWGRHQDEM